MSEHEWRRPVRWLHFALALGISVQLLSSQFMTLPHDHDATSFGVALFRVHVFAGLSTAAVIVLHWLWLAIDRHHLFKHLFPWTRSGIAEVGQDLTSLLRGKLVADGDRGGLSGLVHGLGLLTATTMGMTGVTIFWILNTPDAQKGLRDLVFNAHSLIANLMWAYFIGHVLLAVLHHWFGHPTLKRIFRW